MTLSSLMRLPELVERLLRARRSAVVIWVLALAAVVFAIDWYEGDQLSLGVLYVVPVVVAATVLDSWEVVALAAAFAVLRTVIAATNGPWDAFLRGALAFVAYLAAGAFVIQIAKNRKLAVEHLREIEHQQELTREVERQLESLASSSPAAIFTLDAEGRVLSANAALAEMCGFEKGSDMRGAPMSEHLPVFRDALALPSPPGGFRTAAQCQGTRRNGDAFVAQTWFSTYEAAGGKRLAAIAVDLSEEVREREEENLRQLLDNNRIVAGAVSHEIRNVCGAISVAYSNLRRDPGTAGSDDFQALGMLVGTLERIAAFELQGSRDRPLPSADLREVLRHLSVVIEPGWNECGGKVFWRLPRGATPICGEPFGLMQAFLNLSQNSIRAVTDSARKELIVEAVQAGDGTWEVAFSDSGPGVARPEQLFQPFQPGSREAGLGLYVSRAILRSYGGDLRYDPDHGICRFVATLRASKERG